MALQIRESFEVAAPIERVWDFINTPGNVVACMPGATLDRIVDEHQFVGSVKLKVGAVSAQYQGTIDYTEVDRAAGLVRMVATGNERGGGTVSGTIVTRLEPVPGRTATRVSCDAGIDLTGRIVQVGRGMIEGVSAQIIKKYVANVRATLEAPAAAPGAGPADTSAQAAGEASVAVARAPAAEPVHKEESINVLAVVFKVLLERIRAYLRRVFGGA